jgi:hypothetical protein
MDALLDQHGSLSRTVEQQTVITALGSRHSGSEVHIGDARVITVGANQERPALALVLDGAHQVSRKRTALEWNLEPFDRGLAERHGLVEGGHLLAKGSR